MDELRVVTRIVAEIFQELRSGIVIWKGRHTSIRSECLAGSSVVV
jgi:hypothetical protein